MKPSAMTQTNIQGFSDPKENYYRLPNNWFDFWISFRAEFGDRFAPPLKVLEYVLLHTWGQNKFDGRIRLSANEIHSGRKGRKKTRLDSGVGVSENAVRKAAETLAKMGALNISQNHKDKARMMRTYQPNLINEEEAQAEFDLFQQGFTTPTENYFKVPKVWVVAMRDIGSAAVILAVEYFFRHGWGYHNENGVWLTAEEVANGRKYSDGTRYDNGTGFALATVQRALKKASELGLVVWQEDFDGGIITRKYNLRFQGMKTDASGMFLDETDDANEEVGDANEVVDDAIEGLQANANEAVSDANEDTDDANEEVSDANEERSLKDTPLNTLSRHDLKTPTTPHPTGQSEHRPRQDEHHVVGGGYKNNAKPISKSDIQLPPEIVAALREIGWADNIKEVLAIFEKNPDLVTAWSGYAQKVPQSEIKRTRAALFRYGIRTGVLPPEIPDYNEYFDDDSPMPENIPTPTNTNTQAQEIWKRVLSMLALKLPGSTMDETEGIALEDNTLVIGVRDNHTREICESRLKKTVSNLLIGILNTANTDVKFVVMEPAL